MPKEDMLHIIHQAQSQSDRIGQGIAYIGGSTLATLSSAAQELPASPWVVDLALFCGAGVVVGRLVLDFLKWRDRRQQDRDKE